MAAIFQTTFSNTFSWMKMYEFQLRFHWSLFLRVQLIISQHWFRQWFGTGQATSHCLNHWSVFSQYVKVEGDILKVGGESSTAERCGAATLRGGGHGRGFPPAIGGGPGGLPREIFAKMEVKSSNLVHSEGWFYVSSLIFHRHWWTSLLQFFPKSTSTEQKLERFLMSD